MLDTKKSYCPGCGANVGRAGPCSEMCLKVVRVQTGTAISKEAFCDALTEIDDQTQKMSTKYSNGAICLRVGTNARILRGRARRLPYDRVPKDMRDEFQHIAKDLHEYKRDFEKLVSGKIKLPLVDEGEWLQLRPLTDYEKKMREQVPADLSVDVKWIEKPIDRALLKPEFQGEFRMGVDVAVGKDYTATFELKPHEVEYKGFNDFVEKLGQQMLDAVMGKPVSKPEVPKLPEYRQRGGEKIAVRRKYDYSHGPNLDRIASHLGLVREPRRGSMETDEELRARVYEADEAKGGGVAVAPPSVVNTPRRGDGIHAYDGHAVSRF